VASIQALPFTSDKWTTANDPFAVLDAQNWENPDNMTWDDYVPPPNTNWSDPLRRGFSRNFNIALVAIDYPDEPFVVMLSPNSTVFGNPQAIISGLERGDVPAYYRDLLNLPSELNHGHTLHEYWMEDSAGKYGVNLTAFGAYRMPKRSYQYGVDDGRGGFNPGACPVSGPCSIDLRTDALGAWRRDVGNETADSYELAFILSAGQDESSTWQEFGEMKFRTQAGVTDAFGPPNDTSLPNYASTRYVPWTSWASASTIWPNAGAGSSTQAESSGLGTYAHELSHLIGIGDNYNNPYGEPARRAYTGPWSMLSRGSFNGPGGPHTRWQIPAVQGGSLGCLHTVRDKIQLGLLADNSSVLYVSRESLAESGPVVVELTARSVDPGEGLIGLRVVMGRDRSPRCNVSLDPFCDGGGYNNYDLEVIDRMGADSFTPDSGVMISKTKDRDIAPFQWTIDANPQDIDVVDFYRPDGTASKLSIGDYRQLSDALFHAGTRSGSKAEYVDEANGLQFYIVSARRDEAGVLYYTVGVRALETSDQTGSSVQVKLSNGKVANDRFVEGTEQRTSCTFELTTAGSTSTNATLPLSRHIYRLDAEVDGEGWRTELPNDFVIAEPGKTSVADVAVAANESASGSATVTLTAISESDPSAKATGTCFVRTGRPLHNHRRPS